MSKSNENSFTRAESDKLVARLAAVLETAVDAIITTDDNGRIETFNQAAEQMFRCRAPDVIGQNISKLMPSHHASHHDRYMSEYGTSGKHRVIGRTRQLNASRFDGTEFPIELALSGTEIGGKMYFTGIIRDITERRQAETKLQEYRDHLEQLVTERTAALEATNQRLEKTSVELRDANLRLEKLVRVDQLTGIGNRRAFDERITLEWRRQNRERKPLALLLCDIDNFKLFNDHYGHLAGDACLRKVGSVLRNCFQRANEFAARYGGEEFAIILSGAGYEVASERAETVRRNVSELNLEHRGIGENRCVSISVGMASVVPTETLNHDTLIEAADDALYRAKQKGRNRVETIELSPPD